MAICFSKIVTEMKASELTPILALTARPDIISFAGGLPAEETFPLQELKETALQVMEENGKEALQYGLAAGDKELRGAIADRMNGLYGHFGMRTLAADDMMIVTGSQQGLDIIGRIFLDKGDVVLVEKPSYLGAIGAFDFEGANYVEVPMDKEGMIPDELEKILQTTERVKFIYVIPNFQNPTGICWSKERREKIMEIVSRYEIPVVEDNPYGELRMEGEALPPLLSMDPKHLVIHSGSFSKVLAPGMRLAWVVANEKILSKMTLVKSATDLHTSSLIQREAAMYMKKYNLAAHIKENCKLYKHRRDVMLDSLKTNLPEYIQWTHPEGGLFLWITLPDDWDARELLMMAIDKKVAFVPGDCFFPVSGKRNYFRLNFSYNNDERIKEGIRRLGETIKTYAETKK